MFNPKVTIIIPVYNWSNYLTEAINSALNQTYKNIEILVINDGSNDNWATEKIALSFGNKINYIYKKNWWVSTALNLWIKKSTWEYISWLSHDDLYYPNKIEEQIKYLIPIKNKDTKIIYSNIDIINSDWKIINKSIYDFKNINESNFLFNILTKHIINWCSLLILKNILTELWLFNEKLKTVQDYEVWFKIYEKFNFIKLNKPLIMSRHHILQDSRDPDKFILMMKEEKEVYWNFMKKIWIKKIYNSYDWNIIWFIKKFIFWLYFKINLILPFFIFIWKYKFWKKIISKIR